VGFEWFGHSSLDAKLDLFNALNADYYTSVASTHRDGCEVVNGRVGVRG